MLPIFHIPPLWVLGKSHFLCLPLACWLAPEGNNQHLAPALVGAPGQILGKAVQPPHPPRFLSPTEEGYAQGNGWGFPLVRPCSASCSAPWDLILLWLLLQEWAWASGQPLVMDWLRLSIFSSNAAAAAIALWWASLTSVSSLLAEVPCLPHGVLFCNDQVSAGSDSPCPLGGLPPFCPRQFFKEDTMFLASSLAPLGLHGRDLGNLLSLYTW